MNHSIVVANNRKMTLKRVEGVWILNAYGFEYENPSFKLMMLHLKKLAK